MEKIDANFIMQTLKGWVENKIPQPPSVWVDASMKLCVLLGDEIDLLYELDQVVAQMRVDKLQEANNVSRAKLLVEATNEYKASMKQRAKIKQIEEMIRVAKLQARMRDMEYKSQ